MFRDSFFLLTIYNKSMPQDILDNTLASKDEVHFLIKAGEQYSTAILRSSYYMTTVHCPGVDMAVQVSNLRAPKTENDDEWFNIGTGEFVMCKPAPFKWLRIKLPEPAEQDTVINLLSIKATY